jgi:hypothetical protein
VNENGVVNTDKQLKGEHERVEGGRYSGDVTRLMERMMNVVCVCMSGVEVRIYIYVNISI